MNANAKQDYLAGIGVYAPQFHHRQGAALCSNAPWPPIPIRRSPGRGWPRRSGSNTSSPRTQRGWNGLRNLCGRRRTAISDLAPVHRVAGLLRANAGFYEQAEAEYQRAIELDPSNGDAYRRLGQVYERNNRLDQALAVYKKAVELDPNYFKVYQDLGAYYSARGDDREAARQLEKCVQLAPDEPDPHRVLGTFYKNLGRYTEAERESRIAVGLTETPVALGESGGLP